jgi:hypothetical protein
LTQENDILSQSIFAIKEGSANNVADFINESLKLLQTAYLYLLSETEHLPGFINQRLDQLSEWDEAKKGVSDKKPEQEKDNYKTNIRDSVKRMLANRLVSEKPNGLHVNFSRYVEKTLKVVESKNKKWEEKALSLSRESSPAAIRYTIYQMGALQIEQSIIAAIQQSKLSHPQQ